MNENDLLFPLDLRYHPYIKGPKKWEVIQDISYDMYYKGSGKTIHVPGRGEFNRGYMTDLATVPWPARMLFPKSGKWNHAAVIHDWLCDHGRDDYSQDHIDKEFLNIMGLTDVHPVKRVLAYRLVRRFQKIEACLKGRDYYKPGRGNE